MRAIDEELLESGSTPTNLIRGGFFSLPGFLSFLFVVFWSKTVFEEGVKQVEFPRQS